MCVCVCVCMCVCVCVCVCPLECTSSEMKLQDRNMSRQDAPGSPSCPSHTRAATSSPLSGCRPSLVKQLNSCKSHTRLRRSLRAGLMGRPSASQESQDPQRCRAVCVASVHVVIIMQVTHTPPSRLEGRAHGTPVSIPRIPRPPAMPRRMRGIGARGNS